MKNFEKWSFMKDHELFWSLMINQNSEKRITGLLERKNIEKNLKKKKFKDFFNLASNLLNFYD